MNLIMADQEFEKLQETLGALVQMNTTAALEHVEEIEQSTHASQERTRAINFELSNVVLPK